jgi:hypothetical protein
MSGLSRSLTGASNMKRQAGRMFNSIALLELTNSDAETGDCRAVRFVVSSRGIRRGFPVFQKPADLATADSKYRNRPGIRGYLPNIPQTRVTQVTRSTPSSMKVRPHKGIAHDDGS